MLERLSFMDVHTHLEPRLLRDMDAMSMAHSIEVRPVLVDHKLVDFLDVCASERAAQTEAFASSGRHALSARRHC
jgi:asparagine synthetase B (glutamine-hydrolysing)